MTSTFAVAFLTDSSVSSGLWLSLLIAAVVLAAGIGPIAGWVASAWRSSAVRRIVGAFVLAAVLSLTFGVTQAYAVVISCEWYSVLWWLCG